MSDRTILDGIRVARPCSADWDAMKGDDRTRFCLDCSKNVYNISALTMPEAIQLVTGPGETPCVQFYRRDDGTILTADCPVGVAKVRRSRLRRLAGLAFMGSAFLVSSATALILGRQAGPPVPTASEDSFDEWVDWALIKVGLRPPHRPMIRGDLVPILMTPTATPTPGETEPLLLPCPDSPVEPTNP